jgi:hypothetical protein
MVSRRLISTVTITKQKGIVDADRGFHFTNGLGESTYTNGVGDLSPTTLRLSDSETLQE